MNKEKMKENSALNSESNKAQATDFHGAALIDEDGNEIPITEDMVQDACHTLEEDEDSDPEQKN